MVMNAKYAFLFQGVGTSYRDYLHLLDQDQKEELQQYSMITKKELDLDLWGYLFDAKSTGYDPLFCDWISLYTIDQIVYHTYLQMGLCPDIFLGYSMGLITAMVCGEALSYAQGLHMLLSIYEYPRHAFRRDETMAAIIGMTCKDVDIIIGEYNLADDVEIAIENNEHCIVVSGLKKGVYKVMNHAEEKGALKVKEVNSPYAFHSTHAAQGIEHFANFVEKVPVGHCVVPIMSCFDQEIIWQSDDLKHQLVRNMTGRMDWTSSITKIGASGIQNFVEVSLNDSLIKFSRTIDKKCQFMTYKKILKSECRLENMNIAVAL